MPTVDVLRPASIRDSGAGTAVPSGTLDSVTADDSDSTYISFDVADSGDTWNLRVDNHTPPTNHQRHRIRGRIRVSCDAGTCNERIGLGRGSNDVLEFVTVPVTSSFAEQVTDWYQSGSGFGMAELGEVHYNIGGGTPTSASGATSLLTAECYVDVDCRQWPDYSPEVRDASGTDRSGGTVSDTTQPTLYFGGVDYDGLPDLDWSVSVGSFSSSGSGEPPSSVAVTDHLSDGSYTATFTVRSTIRGSAPFEHTQTIDFDVENIVPPPSPPNLTVVEEFGGYRVSWSDPGGREWDDDYVVAEVYRDDCTGSYRIATVPDALNGSYLDLAIPQLESPASCEGDADPCDITYRVRYWGYVSSEVELPDTIPAELILGWPDTAASIPSGWARVTDLDDRYPLGASSAGTPSATGGSSTHSHTTSSHSHHTFSHTHNTSGNTGTSNSSATTARYSGASKSTTTQPHDHARPSDTGPGTSAGTSGTSSPNAGSEDNLPATRTVIWIDSDGLQTDYPVGALAWSSESVSGWTDDSDSSGRFLKGAPAAGDGGSNSGASTHTHAIDGHTHSGYSHTHSLGDTGLSNPTTPDGAQQGSDGTPKWVPRHTHPLSTGSFSTGSLNSASGGTTGSTSLEPPNRRLRVLRNTGGGIQTRIIGLYLGDSAALDPVLTLCDGGSGTPDMRTWFARDNGSSSVNSTGGSSTHSHTTPDHSHTVGSHTHTISVATSNTTSYERLISSLGNVPRDDHTHTGGDTGSTTPDIGDSGSGTTSTDSHVPPYREAHFVRVDGTVTGGSLPAPELLVSDFSSATVEAFTYGDDLDRLATATTKIAIATDRSYTLPRMVVDSTPLNGGSHTVATTEPGKDLTLSMAVEGVPEIDELESLLSEDRVYFSPLGGTPDWYAPGPWTVQAPVPGVKVIQVTMVAQSWPSTPEPEEYL